MAWTAGFLAAATLLAWSWDRSLVSDTLGTAGQRVLVGVAGFGRDLLGPPGFIAVLALVTALGIGMVWRLQATHPPADIATIIIALSVLPVMLGGAYTALYSFPLIARLAARSRARVWVVGYSSLYALVMLMNYIPSPRLFPPAAMPADSSTSQASSLP